MGESIHISDLKVEEGVEIHGDMDALVASLVFVKEPELEPTPEDEITEPTIVGEEGEEAAGDAEAPETEDQ